MSNKHVAGNANRALAAAVTASLVVLGTAGTAIATTYKQVTVNIDGHPTQVGTWGRDVHAVIKDLGEVTPADAVTPVRTALVSDGQTINVAKAKDYTQVRPSEERTAKSAAATVSDVVSDLSSHNRPAVVAMPTHPQKPMPVADKAMQVEIAHDGKTTTVQVDGGKDLKSVLEQAQVSVTPLDRTTVTSTEDGMKVQVVRVSRATVAKDTVTKKHTTKKVDDPELEEGKTKVVTPGKDEITATTSYQVTEDGKVVHQATLASVVKQAAQEEVVHVGKKPKDDEDDEARPGKGTGSAPEGVWASLAQCESGGNPATNTGNGFYGMYQFTLPTWRSLGGSGLPSDASAEEQTKRAQTLQQRAGWGQWPACARKLGLL
ncbi:MAG: transglycosylase family protein [Actinomycetaceae bacterium]|nr:transglycosylase family protein [Actinomycetaceae bacterium]